MPAVEGATLYIPPTFNIEAEQPEFATLDVDDMVTSAEQMTTDAGWQATVDQLMAAANEVLGTNALNVLEESVNPMTDAVNNGIVPSRLAANFYSWLHGYAGVDNIPTTGTYAFVEGYILQWARQYGWATLVGPPAPTPAGQAAAASPTPTLPLPGVVNPPATLPSPSVGQSQVGKAAREIVPSHVSVTGLSPETAAAIQAAVGVASADVLKAQAAVVDDLLPNMAPGQVPQALSQLNTAVNALVHQMSLVRAGVYPTGFVGVQQALNGGLQALNGAEQAIQHLTDQLAEKADSGLETDIKAVSLTLAGVAGTVATVVGTTVPALEGELGTLTGTVNKLGDQVTNTIEPELARLTPEVNANTAKLALTTDECLAQLCDELNNVGNPIQKGGATPGLLGKLGGLLGAVWGVGALLALFDTLETLLNSQAAISAMVSDVEQLAGWASSAATAIEADLPLS
jgi:hypothetical protein